MRFLVDAQLPARLAGALRDAGHDAVHTTDLPNGNHTSDAEIAEVADREDRIVVTKDRDFRDSHLIQGRPARLLVIATGNITNRALLALIDQHLKSIVAALDEVAFVELTSAALVLHSPDSS